MNKLKAILMCAALLAGGFAASARNVNTLLINRTDGKTDKIAIHKELNITRAENGDILMVHPSITVAYPVDLVKNLTPGFQSFATDKYYIGDHELKEEDALTAPEVDGLSFSIVENQIIITGMQTGVRLIDLSGKVIYQASASDGQATISTTALPTGVYLLQADSTTVKVKI